MIFSLFKERSRRKASVRSAYETIVAAARQARFYEEWNVPDTVEGRFEMVALHMFLALDRMTDKAFAQDLTDEFFRDMDRSIREMGASDVSVPKKVRRLAEAFHGRAAAYRLALSQSSQEGLEAALRRNVFGEGGGDAAALSAYVSRQYDALNNAAPAALRFLDPA